MGIETICCGGYGGSAEVHIQIRNIFPGLGGVIRTEQDFVAACRIPRGTDLAKINNPDSDITFENLENKATLSSLNVYFRHTLIKKLDDYFFRTGKYRFSHIPRPLGSDIDGIYYYEWVFGDEGFYPQYYDEYYKRWFPVKVDEWNIASGCFNEAGVGIFDDTVENDGYYIKNVVMLEPKVSDSEESLTKLWKRIDFGSESLHIDFSKFEKFIIDNKNNLEKILTSERVEMMLLILEFLMNGHTPKTFNKMKKMSELVFDYRKSTTRHMSRLDRCHIKELEHNQTKTISYKSAREIQDLAYSKRIKSDNNFSLDLEIRSGFKSIDGVIYTLQEIPVAKISSRRGNTFYSGFDHFARHFLVKKLEDAFISAGYYSYPHITRPLGSENNSYYYEWVYGYPKCPKELVFLEEPAAKGVKGLDTWYEFYNLFAEAGVDMRNKMSYAKTAPEKEIQYAQQIIVRQPISNDNPKYISRLWKRIEFDENNTPIDFQALEKYMKEKENFLKSNLSANRYETMVIMIKYLLGDASQDEYEWLKDVIHSYRISTLRHLNYSGFGLPPEGFTDLHFDNNSTT